MTATITRRMKKKVTVSRPLGGEEKHKDGMNALNYSAVHKFAIFIFCNENILPSPPVQAKYGLNQQPESV